MALARLNIPGVALYGGSIDHGKLDGKSITIQQVFEAVGAHGAGKIDDARLSEVERKACPGAGACGGQFTANTMAMMLMALGLSPLGFNDVAATDPAKRDVARRCGELAVENLKRNLRPRDVLSATAVSQRRAHRQRDRGFDQCRSASARDRERSAGADSRWKISKSPRRRRQ